MNSNLTACINAKNAWLTAQVDVEYPTQTSVEGRDVYLEAQAQKEYLNVPFVELNEKIEQLESMPSDKKFDEVVLVDFHRLSIIFAQVQASRWSDDHQQKQVIEFLTQIILSDQFNLIIAIKDQQPVGAAIYQVSDDKSVAVFSDITLKVGGISHQQFFVQTMKALNTDCNEAMQFYCER